MLARLRTRFWMPPRAHGDVIEDRTVSFLELFYDLVYVVVIAQATHTLADDPTWQTGGQFVVIFSLIWIAWLNGTLYYDLHGREDVRTRFFVFVQMGLLALLAVFAGHAADETGSEFAIVYTLYLVVLAYLWWTVRRVDSAEYNRLTGQYLVTNAVAIVVMATSIFLDDQARVTLWTVFVVGYLLAAVAINARSDILADITDSTVERFGLFTIIVLGEVVVGVVDGLSEVEIDFLAVVTGLLGLCVGFALWWTYFDFAGRRLPRRTSLSQLQWIFGHLPFAMSIAVVGGSMVSLIEHAHDASTPSTTAWLLAGAVALGLVANVVIMTSLSDYDRVREVYGPVTVAMLGAVVLTLAVGAIAPAPWLLALSLVVILSAVWIFAVDRLLRMDDPERALPSGAQRHGSSEG